MKKIKLIILTLIILSSCQHDKKLSGYEINGIIRNVEDSTAVFLSLNNKNIDTAIVIGEKFQFIGNIKEPTRVYLHFNNSRDFKVIWIENSIIRIEGEKGNFKESKITGSLTQKDNDLWWSRVRPLRKIQDSLLLIIRDRSIEKSYYDSVMAVYNEISEKEHKINQAFINEFPNSLMSASLLNVYKTTWGKEITNELYLSLSQESQVSNDGRKIARFIELNKNPQIGEKYVDFEQENVLGEKIRLSNIKGKYILVEFWASWCGPCRKANPDLVKVYDQYKNKGFEILGVSIDQDRDKWINAIEKDSLIWENVSDLIGGENEAALIYGVYSVPDNVLINEDGIIIGRKLRGNSLKNKLQELLGDKANLY